MRCVVLLLLALALPGQTQSAPQALEGEALSILAAVDARIAAPLKASAFRFELRPRVKAPDGKDGEAGFRVRYSWREGCGDRIEFLDDASAVLEHAPDAPENLRAEARAHHLEAARGLAAFVRGRSLVDTWAHCRGRVEKSRVNGREEIQLILEPAVKKHLRHAALFLDRRGVPWKIERTMLDGARLVQHPQYELAGELFALQALQHIEIPANARDAARQYAWEIKWQRVAGQLVPASIAKLSKDLKEPGLGLSAILGLCLDAEVPPFEPERAPR